MNVLKFIKGMDLNMAKTIIAKFDTNGDGMLQYSEFKLLMKDDNFIQMDSETNKIKMIEWINLMLFIPIKWILIRLNNNLIIIDSNKISEILRN